MFQLAVHHLTYSELFSQLETGTMCSSTDGTEQKSQTSRHESQVQREISSFRSEIILPTGGSNTPEAQDCLYYPQIILNHFVIGTYMLQVGCLNTTVMRTYIFILLKTTHKLAYPPMIWEIFAKLHLFSLHLLWKVTATVTKLHLSAAREWNKCRKQAAERTWSSERCFWCQTRVRTDFSAEN